MYTPADLTSRRRIFGDRPYGGWLFGVWMADAFTEDVSDHVELYAGVIGRDAHAEQAQTFIHRYVVPAAPDPKGWHNQIGEQAGVLAVAQRRLHWIELHDRHNLVYFDATPAVGGAAGNVFIYGRAGATVRAGFNLPRTFLEPIPALAVAPDGAEAKASGARPDWDAHVFATAEARFVVRNVFIDSAGESYGIRGRDLVRDHRFGVSIRIKHIRVQYAHTVRSPEFRPGARSQSFGTITLSVESNP